MTSDISNSHLTDEDVIDNTHEQEEANSQFPKKPVETTTLPKRTQKRNSIGLNNKLQYKF